MTLIEQLNDIQMKMYFRSKYRMKIVFDTSWKMMASFRILTCTKAVDKLRSHRMHERNETLPVAFLVAFTSLKTFVYIKNACI